MTMADRLKKRRNLTYRKQKWITRYCLTKPHPSEAKAHWETASHTGRILLAEAVEAGCPKYVSDSIKSWLISVANKRGES